jgi:hypothetical protein
LANPPSMERFFRRFFRECSWPTSLQKSKDAIVEIGLAGSKRRTAVTL